LRETIHRSANAGIQNQDESIHWRYCGHSGVIWLFFSFSQLLTGQVSLNAEILLIRLGMPVCLLIAGTAVFTGNVKEEKRLKQKTGGNEDG
jgi:hypothetical protein